MAVAGIINHDAVEDEDAPLGSDGNPIPLVKFLPARAFGRQTPAESKKIGRNDPCPCGSGRKHKKCCGLGLLKYQIRFQPFLLS